MAAHCNALRAITHKYITVEINSMSHGMSLPSISHTQHSVRAERECKFSLTPTATVSDHLTVQACHDSAIKCRHTVSKYTHSRNSMSNCVARSWA